MTLTELRQAIERAHPPEVVDPAGAHKARIELAELARTWLPALADVAEAAAEALGEAQGALDNAKDGGETETYCYGNLVHIARGLRAALERLGEL